MGEIISVPVEQIKENPVALRAVNRQDEKYLGIVDSMRQKGFLGAITARKKTDEAGEEFYELLDGLHRYSAAKDAGIAAINIDVQSMSDAEALELQVMMNVHKVDTKPVEYSKGLRRLLSMNPLMTEAELAAKLGQSAQWVKDRLGLNKFSDEIANLIDEGKITLSNAYALAKLPEEERPHFIDRAITQAPDEFVPQCNARVKEIRDAKRKGADAKPREFQPVAHMQKMVDVKKEVEVCEIGSSLCASQGLTTAEDGWRMALNWMLHLDPESVAVQKAKDDARQAARDVAKEKRSTERKAKVEAAEKAKAEAAAETQVAIED